jgi:hypothetical protein
MIDAANNAKFVVRKSLQEIRQQFRDLAASVGGSFRNHAMNYADSLQEARHSLQTSGPPHPSY